MGARMICLCRVAVIAAVWLFLPLVSRASTNHHVILITIDGLAAFYLSDPQAPLPTLRKLAAEGAAAEGLHVSNPSVTWPNHTTLVTGVRPERHSVLFNGRLMRGGPGEFAKIDPSRDKSDLVAVPTVYDHLHGLGYRTADINWPCTRGAKTLDDSFPDVPESIKHTTPRLREELIAAGILEDGTDASFRRKSAAARDRIWTAAAVHVIEARRPNLLLFHMLITDSTQHRDGPQSPPAYTAVALADAQLAEILGALEAAGIRDRTTLFITSDHGFERVTRHVKPNVVFRKAGWLEPGRRGRVQAISEGGIAFVYLNDPATREADRARVIEMLGEHEGIAEIIEPNGYGALGLPEPAKNQQAGDLILVAKGGYGFSNDAEAENSVAELTSPSGSHGYLASNPKMNGVFVASGRGIKRGVKLGIVDNADVAPTIAKLLGQELPSADGKVLEEILMDSVRR